MAKLEQFIEIETDTARVQGKVPRPIYKELDKIRRRKKLKWDQILEAMFKRVVAEEK